MIMNLLHCHCKATANLQLLRHRHQDLREIKKVLHQGAPTIAESRKSPPSPESRQSKINEGGTVQGNSDANMMNYAYCNNTEILLFIQIALLSIAGIKLLRTGSFFHQHDVKPESHCLKIGIEQRTE